VPFVSFVVNQIFSSAERRRHRFDLLTRRRLDRLDRGEKVRVRHASAEIGPAHALDQRPAHLFTLTRVKLSPNRPTATRAPAQKDLGVIDQTD